MLELAWYNEKKKIKSMQISEKEFKLISQALDYIIIREFTWEKRERFVALAKKLKNFYYSPNKTTERRCRPCNYQKRQNLL